MVLREERLRAARAKLVELGVAEYAKNMYHGRAGNGEEWKVDPSYDNTKNGNFNINKQSGLYVGDQRLATFYANYEESSNPDLTAEVHKIVSYDDNAIILDLTFEYATLTDEQRQEFRQAMKVLGNFGISQANPIKYEYKDAVEPVKQKIEQCKIKNHFSLLNVNDIKGITSELKNGDILKQVFGNQINKLEKFVLDSVGALNTKITFERVPSLLKRVFYAYQDGETEYQFEDPITNEKTNIPINHDYISAWCAENGIIGTRYETTQSRIGIPFQACHIFDLKKIMTEKQYGTMLSNMFQNYGEITNTLANLFGGNREIEKLFAIGNSEEILAFIKQDQRCKELFEKSAHVWQGWNVGQHTQAVLNFFDDYYQIDVDERLRPFIKLCLLTHDIGKGNLDKNLYRDFIDCKTIETQLNLQSAPAVFDALQLAPEYRKLINFVIADSQSFTSNIVLENGDRKALYTQLKDACQVAYVNAFGKNPTNEEVNALRHICVILQECDSGAYTRYATIRESGKSVDGGDDNFTNSFVFNRRGEPRLRCFMELENKQSIQNLPDVEMIK